jgi:hypothetical protein
LNGTYATTGSNTFAGIQTVNSNLVVTGSITAQTLVVQTVTSSVIYSSGSNVFGNNIANTQVFTGSVYINGSQLSVGTSSIWAYSNLNAIQVNTATIYGYPSVGGFASNVYFDSSFKYITGGGGGYIENSSGNWIFLTTPSGSAGSVATLTTRMFISSSGNVGIGTITPSYTLDVTGTGRYTSAALNTIQLTNTGVSHGMTGWAPTNTVGSLGSYDAAGNFAIIGFSSTAAQSGLSLFGFIGVTDPTDTVPAILLNAGKKNGTAQQALGSLETTFQFTNAGTVQMTILGAGDLLLNATSPVVGAQGASGGRSIQLAAPNYPQYFWQTTNAALNEKLWRAITRPNGVFQIQAMDDTGQGAETTAIEFTRSGATISAIKFPSLTSNGTLSTSAGNGTLVVSSDSTMKIDAGLIENGLEKVLSLKPRYFYWKDEEKFGNKKHLGFYAQEVNEISEEASNTPDKGQGWGIYDRALIAMLTKAIQELQAQITELKNK